MIHKVLRDEIRMHGGEVIVTDPIQEQEWDNILPDLRDFAQAMIRVLGDVTDGYLVVRNYDRLDSVIASTPTLVMIRNIASIGRKTVDIETDSSVSFPVVVD